MVTKSKTAATETAAAPAEKSASPAKPAVDPKLLATVPERYRNFVRPGFAGKDGKPVTLASLVKTVNDSYAKADDHTLTCACAIAACKQRVESGEAGKGATWYAFAKENFPQLSERRLRELALIGAAPNPGVALYLSRETKAAAMRESRGSNKATTLASPDGATKPKTDKEKLVAARQEKAEAARAQREAERKAKRVEKESLAARTKAEREVAKQSAASAKAQSERDALAKRVEELSAQKAELEATAQPTAAKPVPSPKVVDMMQEAFKSLTTPQRVVFLAWLKGQLTETEITRIAKPLANVA